MEKNSFYSSVTKKTLSIIWIVTSILIVTSLFSLIFTPWGLFPLGILSFGLIVFTVNWRKENIKTIKNNASPVVKIINHEKRIKDWGTFYYIMSLLNIAFVIFLASVSGFNYIVLLLAVPAIILSLITLWLVKSKSVVASATLLSFMILLLLINAGLHALYSSGGGSLFLIIGLIGAVKCFNSARKLKSQKK